MTQETRQAARVRTRGDGVPVLLTGVEFPRHPQAAGGAESGVSCFPVLNGGGCGQSAPSRHCRKPEGSRPFPPRALMLVG